MTRAPVEAGLLVWARERAGFKLEDLTKKFPKLPEWESGEILPTLNQIDDFARAVHVPVGYLFLSKPPDETLPIPDFRTFDGKAVERPSPNLLDMIHVCIERQDWYRDFLMVEGGSELQFIGSATVETPAETAATRIRETLGFDIAAREECSTWVDAMHLFIRQAEDSGILVMVSGVVMSNNHRRLDPDEFRGFALSDPLAPLVFVNGADTKAAQMFTLAHELGHLWLGKSALSNMEIMQGAGFRREEVWCNAVAAEILVPLDALRAKLDTDEPLRELASKLAREFKVSTLVMLRRLLDAGRVERAQFEAAWVGEIGKLHAQQHRKTSGGDFRLTTLARVSRRFARALVASTLEGQTLYRDAFRMLGISKASTLDKIGREAGVSE